jgi:UDP:flavonoid glycosyltransferase YjiC (YdhE family)
MNSSKVKRLKRASKELAKEIMEVTDDRYEFACTKMYRDLKKSYTTKKIKFKND